MKGNVEVIGALNEALAEELTAINQYFMHAEMCENWGFHKLASMIKKESIDEMKHAESIIERILFLDGMPNMAKVSMNIGQNVPDLLGKDLNLEVNAVGIYNRIIRVSVEAGDQASAELLKQILKDEERHVDEIETQLNLLKELGLQNYLTTQV